MVVEALVFQCVRTHAAALVVPGRDVTQTAVTRHHSVPVTLPARLCNNQHPRLHMELAFAPDNVAQLF